MKKTRHHLHTRGKREAGFALVSSLMLMVLITVISIGLLSLASIRLSVLCAALLVAPLSAETITLWDMTPAGGWPAKLDLATSAGQGSKAGSATVAEAQDHLLSVNGNGDSFATSTTVTRDPGTGNFYLSLDLTQSLDLEDWDDLPVSSGDMTVSGGNILVELPEPPSPAAFWRFAGSQGSTP